MIFVGIDAGSRAVKVVIFDAGRGRVLGSGLADQGVRQGRLARELFHQVLRKHRVDRRRVARVVATGYARYAVEVADAAVTEITCHAAGVRHHAPLARTVVEIGGQDSKVIRLAAEGGVGDFAMNDRCAAGTGRFLEMVASRLEIKLSGLGRLAARSRKPAAISSMCVVFAETEIIGLLAGGVRRENIVAGVQRAVAARVRAMAGRQVAPPVVFTGGVALVAGMDRALSAALGHPVAVAPQPQFTGALGAALIAAQQAGRR